jgi:hypothetical protein
MKLTPIPLVRSWLTSEPQDSMSKPTLTDWYQHIPSYGGIVIIVAIQTLVLLILLKRRADGKNGN